MKMNPGITAIDPGASGGIAWVDDDGNVHAQPLPESISETVDSLRTLKTLHGARWEVFLEEVPFGISRGAFVGAMAKLHRKAGILEGALMALGARVIKVRPQAWQSGLGIGAKKDDPKRWKAKLRDEAARRFPGVTVTLKTADALLILEHAHFKP